jgi:hypothetical protein
MEVAKLIEHWKSQGFEIHSNSLLHLQTTLEAKSLKLPDDFIHMYLNVNGMDGICPDFDEEGFCFYPIEDLTTLDSYYKEYYPDKYNGQGDFKEIVIFADYMHESWLYGVKTEHDGSYSIGIIALYGEFTFITHSLTDFINLYIENSPVLYNYK